MKTSVKGLAVLGLSAISLQANAAVIEYDFRNFSTASYQSSYSYEESGIDLDVTGYKYSNTYSDFIDADVSSSRRGLGVYGGKSNRLLDGRGGDERLVFEFSEAVELDSITFWNFRGNDDATIVNLDDDALWTFIEIDRRDVNGRRINTYEFSFAALTDLFAIDALEGNDEFAVRSITVNSVAVPEPFSLSMFGLGLAGIAFLRRRKNA